MTQNSKWYGKYLDERETSDRLRARVAELEAALAPFANYAYHSDPCRKLDEKDWKAARAALGEQAGSEEAF